MTITENKIFNFEILNQRFTILLFVVQYITIMQSSFSVFEYLDNYIGLNAIRLSRNTSC